MFIEQSSKKGFNWLFVGHMPPGPIIVEKGVRYSDWPDYCHLWTGNWWDSKKSTSDSELHGVGGFGCLRDKGFLGTGH